MTLASRQPSTIMPRMAKETDGSLRFVCSDRTGALICFGPTIRNPLLSVAIRNLRSFCDLIRFDSRINLFIDDLSENITENNNNTGHHT